MQLSRVTVASMAMVALSLSAFAAPLDQNRNQDRAPAGPRAADGDRILPGPPVARAKAAAMLADRDGNRLSDGLDSLSLMSNEAVEQGVVVNDPTAFPDYVLGSDRVCKNKVIDWDYSDRFQQDQMSL